MRRKPLLHFFCPLHVWTGSVHSALTLCVALKERVDIKVWSLPVEKSIDPAVKDKFAALGWPVDLAWPIPELPSGSHLFFHMGEYPIVLGNHVDDWRRVFKNAGSVQISINYNIGSLYQHHWLAKSLSQIYFQNQEMVDFWKRKTAGSPLVECDCMVLPPPVDLEAYLKIVEPDPVTLVIGRLTGDAKLPMGVVEFYNELSQKLPHAEFWFMPTPEIIKENFSDHPKFHLFNKNEITVDEFITAMDIYCVPTNPNAQTLQGTRTLVEVMAAGRACVFVDRLGPKDRIVHGESGFKTNSLDEMQDYVVRLANNAELRTSIGLNARERAQGWRVLDWRDAILEHIV
ncbi:MAG: glycosyltransferase [Gammaproteobacteria bacterium]|nr:glycosyltransferase [Gammaproteobacteria bacterium]